ncbi:MAG: YihY/virulence factor BrkB family protein [Octadecabacter sp.]|nr:YihY/virulence factor BrkB family protein [Octadecabacter sp.]
MWRETVEVVRQVLDDIGEKNAGLISAGVAFYGLFAIFPGIAAVIALFGLLADPAIVETQLDLMVGLMPPAVFELFQSQIDGLLSAGTGTLGFASLLSIGLALWSARAGVAALILGLNAIYGRPNRSSLRHVLVALLLTICLVGIAIVALLMVVVTPIVLALVPFDTDRGLWLEVIRWLVAMAVLFLGLGLLYRYGPNRSASRTGWVTPGSVLVIVLWFGVSIGFSIYVANFSNYNEVYGSIGAVIALLFWFYLSAFLVLVGASLNITLERRKPI